MTSTTLINKKLSLVSPTTPYKNRQSQLFRDLEKLLDLTPSTFSSPLLSLPAHLRAHIISYLLPPGPADLHTCLWGAEMIGTEPWRHSIVGYGSRVPAPQRLARNLQLVNQALRREVLCAFWAQSNLTLHAELRNTKFQNDLFDYSPHILRLPLLPHVSRVRLYVEWNYTLTKAATKAQRVEDYVRMTEDFCKAMEEVLARMESVEGIELSVLFFWKYRSGKVYNLTMSDLFEVEDVLKKYAEPRWLAVLERAQEKRKRKKNEEQRRQHAPSDPAVAAPALDEGAGVGYKLSSEKKGVEQSGGMEIFVSADLEACMGKKRKEVDFYGNFAVNETLPQPSYEAGNMI